MRIRFTAARADEPFRFLGVAFGQTCPFLSTPHLRLSRPKPWGPTDRIGPARPPTHDARSVGAVKAYPSSVSVTVVRAVRSLADSTLLSYELACVCTY